MPCPAGKEAGVPISEGKKDTIEWLSSIGTYIGAFALAAMTILLTVEVIMRYLFRSSTLISDEMSGYLFVAMLYMAMSDTLVSDKHIKINVITERLKPRLQRAFARIVAMILPVLGGVLSWQAWILVIESYERHSISPTILRLPQYLPEFAVPLGLSIFTLQALARAITMPASTPEAKAPPETKNKSMVDGA